VEARIGGVGEETGAQRTDGFLHAFAQALKGARALLAGLLGPLLQPTQGGTLALDPGLMAQEPEQAKVRVQLAVHHGGEVELHVGLTGKTDVVSENPQLEPVGDEGPEVVVGAVEELLHQSVGAGLGGADLTGSTLIQLETGADEVDRGMAPEVRDRIALAVDFEGGVALQAPVAQLVEQREQPAVARQAGGRVSLRKALQLFAEARPQRREPVPGAVGGLVDALALRQVVLLGADAGQLCIEVRNAGDKLRGQEQAFGFDRGEGLVGSGHRGRCPRDVSGAQGELRQKDDPSLVVGFIEIASVGGQQGRVRSAERRGVVESVEQVMTQPDRQVHGGLVGCGIFDGLPLDESQIREIVTSGLGLLTGKDRSDLREEVRRLPQSEPVGIDTREQGKGWLDVRFAFPFAEKPFECDACVDNQVHGRPSCLAAAISDSDRIGAWDRRSRIRRMASWRCRWCSARSMASRISSVMMAFLS